MSPALGALPAGGHAHQVTRQSPSVQDELHNRIRLHDRSWTDNDVLSLNPTGAAHSIQLMWQAGTQRLRCWYVHPQEPLRRTPIGFDTMDQVLDIVISPDKSHWRRKDEDEFAEAERTSLYSPKKAFAIQAEGKGVIEMLAANASPFCDGWEHWKPPGEWSIPTFPPDWEKYPL